MRLAIALVTLAAIPSFAQQSGSLVHVSIPVNSQDEACHPLNDGVWSVTAPPYPLDTSTGIGNIVREPIDLLAASMHDHKYISDYVPDPDRAVVTFNFEHSTSISGVEVIQHTNGVTKLEGLIGSSLSSLQSIGTVVGPKGDVVGSQLFTEGESHVFQFPTLLSGTVLRIIIRKTSLSNGYALYRLFPLDAQGNRILGVGEKPLNADLAVLSLTNGGTQSFALNTGPQPLLNLYLLIGSQSGTTPGLPVDSLVLPLNLDAYLLYTIQHPNSPALTNTLGVLLPDGTTAGAVSFNLPPGLSPALAGTSLHHAYVVFDLATAAGQPFVSFVSNAAPLSLML